MEVESDSNGRIFNSVLCVQQDQCESVNNNNNSI